MLILFQCIWLLFLDQINDCDSNVPCFLLLSMPLNNVSALILEKKYRGAGLLLQQNNINILGIKVLETMKNCYWPQDMKKETHIVPWALWHLLCTLDIVTFYGFGFFCC